MGWKDGGIVDLFGLILFLDATTPPIFNKMGTVGWVPTLTLTSHIRNIPKPGPLKVIAKTELAHSNLCKIFFNHDLTFDEVRDVYCSADLVVIPSLYEGFGFAVGEAMACNKAVVTTDGGAIPEVIGDCGIVVDTQDSLQLEEGIKKLFKDEVLKSKLADKGYERAVRFLNWDIVASEVTKVYEESIKSFKE